LLNRGFVVLVGVPGAGRVFRSSSGPRRGSRQSWRPVGLVDDAGVAEGMVRLLCERTPEVQACVVPLNQLAAKLGGEEAERILDRLHNPTTAEIARANELAGEAADGLLETGGRERSARQRPPAIPAHRVDPQVGPDIRSALVTEPAAVPKPPRRKKRRSKVDRRSGTDRRLATATGPPGRATRSIERRVSGERRSGADRRKQPPLPAH
jgi:hypothetical protein